MDNVDDVLKDFLRSTRTMESNIVSIISESNRDIEMILKELLIYLDSTAKNLSHVQDSLTEFINDLGGSGSSPEVDNVIAIIKTYYSKIVELEAQNTKKILQMIKGIGEQNKKVSQYLLQVYKKLNSLEEHNKLSIVDRNEQKEILSDIRDILKTVSYEVSETKTNVSKNQDNLMTVIGNMMDSSDKKMLASDKVEVQKIKSEEAKYKAKTTLVKKIVMLVLGSGGVLYSIIDMISGG